MDAARGLVMGRNPFIVQARLFDRLGLSETLFFADARAGVLDTLRLGPRWAHRTRAPLALALALAA